MKKIAIVGTKIYTYDCIEDLINGGYSISKLITISTQQAEKYHISGFFNLSSQAKQHNIEIYYPNGFSLRSKDDLQTIREMDIDLLIVAGWSRLIPEEILASLSLGAIGCHGSSKGLPKGRGRAALNWALIKGATEFHLSIFFLDPGVDSGKIIASTCFEINSFDTGSTLRDKCWLSFTEMLLNHLPEILEGKAQMFDQPSEKPSYYPKREPEDGAIDWNRSTNEIHALVRSVTKPYPGAFTFINHRKVYVWQTQPFDSLLTFPNAIPGQIVRVFCAGHFIVKTADSSLLVTNCEGINPSDLRVGQMFDSVDYGNTLAEIRRRYPDSVGEDQREI